jgi:iron(III) transport system substrate-binding protein
VVANMARTPKGGDTDQIKAVAAGECAIALSNTYYYARIMRSTQPADREIIAKTAVVFPDQGSYGTHVNISGAGVLKSAPHKENALKFLEYLASNDAQRYFADGNNEWPVVPTVAVTNPALDALGKFKIDPLPIATYGKNTAAAQRLPIPSIGDDSKRAGARIFREERLRAAAPFQSRTR